MGRRQELEQRQSLLARFGRMVAAETSLDTLLGIIAEEVRNILSADRCSVFLVDFYKGELWTKIALGMEEKILRIPIGQGIAGFVARTGSVPPWAEAAELASASRPVARRDRRGAFITALMGTYLEL